MSEIDCKISHNKKVEQKKERLQGIGELNISLECLEGILERFAHFDSISSLKNSHPPLPVQQQRLLPHLIQFNQQIPIQFIRTPKKRNSNTTNNYLRNLQAKIPYTPTFESNSAPPREIEPMKLWKSLFLCSSSPKAFGSEICQFEK